MNRLIEVVLNSVVCALMIGINDANRNIMSKEYRIEGFFVLTERYNAYCNNICKKLTFLNYFEDLRKSLMNFKPQN